MEYIASLSYGKDSIVIPELCIKYGLPLNRIVTVDIMATPTLHAELPPMVEFKKKADKIIKERYGIEVEHITAPKSYEEIFYAKKIKGENKDTIYGFPMIKGAWCNSRLKLEPLNVFGKDENITQYLGICADEPKRIERLNGTNKIPLPAKLGYTEKMCYDLAKLLDLLSPIYENATRGGCWFCHNQSIEQLRFLRKNYPDYWALMLKWDRASPVTFRPDGHTLMDFDKRFGCEEKGIIPTYTTFNWNMLENEQLEKRLKNMENTITTFKKIKDAETAVDNYYKKLATCEKSAWSLAQLIYDTVNAPNFAECFSSMREYAKAINMDVSNVTRKCKAVERKLYIEQNLTELPQLGVSQIIETAPIEDSKLEEFVSLNEITEKSTVKEVREAVKDFLGKTEAETEAEAEEAEETEEAEEAEAKPKSMYIEYNDTSYEIFSPETIEKILELLQ